MSDASNFPLVIVNPKSAGGATRTSWAAAAADFRAHFGAFQVAFTKKQGDGIELAKRAARGGRKFIIACGGDGTINEVANGILQSGAEDAELGVLPSGTGGDFRRTLGIPTEVREAARILREGVTKQIDVGKVSLVNHADEPATRYFLNVSSFGLSAAINERVKTKEIFKWLPGNALRGKAKFAVSTLQEILDFEFVTVRVSLDGAAAKPLNTINFCVCNARYFGGGMKIAPDALIDDALFDVVNIGDIKTAKIILNVYKLYRGSHLELTEVKAALASRVEVSAARENQTIFLETDGELPGKLPAVYEIAPRVLKVRVPQN
ncbi:MAG: diacylglycerol/lipid kinase family protein [Pyrinomonadaceae bacterium]